MKATQCNHRKDVDKCPITLNTKASILVIIIIVTNYKSFSSCAFSMTNFQLGCELKTTITNKGAKILVSPKVEISGGCQQYDNNGNMHLKSMIRELRIYQGRCIS